MEDADIRLAMQTCKAWEDGMRCGIKNLNFEVAGADPEELSAALDRSLRRYPKADQLNLRLAPNLDGQAQLANLSEQLTAYGSQAREWKALAVAGQGLQPDFKPFVSGALPLDAFRRLERLEFNLEWDPLMYVTPPDHVALGGLGALSKLPNLRHLRLPVAGPPSSPYHPSFFMPPLQTAVLGGLSQLHSLELQLEDSSPGWLLSSFSTLVGLRRLVVHGRIIHDSPLTDTAFGVFIHLCRLPFLEDLDLHVWCNDPLVPGAGAPQAAWSIPPGSRSFRSLKRLALKGRVNAPLFTSLQNVTGLESLKLQGQLHGPLTHVEYESSASVLDEPVVHLPLLRGLRELTIHLTAGTLLTRTVAMACGTCLRHLSLSWTERYPAHEGQPKHGMLWLGTGAKDAMAPLAAAASLRHLESLVVNCPDALTDEGLARVRWPSLTRLVFSGVVDSSSSGCAWLAKLGSLRVLSLSHVPGHDQVAYLSRRFQLGLANLPPQLQSLTLARAELLAAGVSTGGASGSSSSGAGASGSAQQLSQLTELELSGCTGLADAVPALARAPLTRLAVRDSELPWSTVNVVSQNAGRGAWGASLQSLTLRTLVPDAQGRHCCLQKLTPFGALRHLDLNMPGKALSALELRGLTGMSSLQQVLLSAAQIDGGSKDAGGKDDWSQLLGGTEGEALPGTAPAAAAATGPAAVAAGGNSSGAGTSAAGGGATATGAAAAAAARGVAGGGSTFNVYCDNVAEKRTVGLRRRLVLMPRSAYSLQHSQPPRPLAL